MADDHTYRRVLENGEWVMRRVPATQDLPNGSPVFPAVVGEGTRTGGKPFNDSSVVDHLLKRDRIYIRSQDMNKAVLTNVLVPRLMDYLERGFDWIIEAAANNGHSQVSLFNEKLGQMFILYFRHQSELAEWAMYRDVKPYRIRRKNVPFDDPWSGEVIPVPSDNAGFDLLFGKPVKKPESSGFGRMVDLE